MMHGWDRLRKRAEGAAKSGPSPRPGRDGRTRPGQTQRAHRDGLTRQTAGRVFGPCRMTGALIDVPVPNDPEAKINHVARSRRHPSVLTQHHYDN